MDIVNKIHGMIEPSLEAMGYSIVLIKMGEGASRKTLSIMAERSDGVMMSFNDCTQISHTVSALLEVDDPITGAYNLEVCSPGTDRPLTRAADFARYAGCEAKIETMLPVDNRRRFRGKLLGMKSDLISLHMPEGDVDIAFSNVRMAKLVPEFTAGPGAAKEKKKKKKK